MDLFKKIVLLILSIQEKMLTKSLANTLGQANIVKQKRVFQNGCLLSLNSVAESEKQRFEEELELILKSCHYEPNEILEYIKKHNTDVFYIDSAKLLHSIGENEGFIYPQKGAKALYISSITSKSLKIKTKEMFILTKGEVNKYSFIYHFYNWYTFKHGLSGIDSDSQKMLNKYLFDSQEEDFNKLQLSDIYKLKDAINQDKAAIDFVFKLCKKYFGAQEAIKKIKNDGASI